MGLDLHPKDYAQEHKPKKNVIDFFKGTLTDLGWNRSGKKDVIMDVGCGHGRTTKEVVLPFFHKMEKIIAFDVVPGMIDIAKEKNAHPTIEYEVADIGEWSTVERWEGKISKMVVISCFHWVKDQKRGLENIHRLLMPGGEAALFFVVEATFYDLVESLQKNPKWNQYLKDVDNRIPQSHYCKYDALHYKNLAETVGFEVLHCIKEEKIDVNSSDESIKVFLSSLCVLMPYIPKEYKEDFQNDILQEVLERDGRTETGLPCHKAKILEFVIRKK